jgi:hypothetical protein
MRKRRIGLASIIPLAAALVASCATSGSDGEVQSIIRRCGLEGQLTVELTGKRDLRIVHRSPDAEYQKVDFFLEGIRPLNLNLGFVGNEALSVK